MDWKKESERDLNTFAAKQLAIQNTSERIQSLQFALSGIKAVSCDPIHREPNQLEDRNTNLICEIERLRMTFRANELLVNAISHALDSLDPREYLVLKYFYIDRPQRHTELLMEELHVEKSMVYKIKDAALYKFTIALYGIIEY